MILGGMRRAVERSALGSVGLHFWGFFGEFFRSLQSDPPAVICYVSDKLKFKQRFFFQRIHFLNQNLMLALLGKACIFVIFFGIYTHWPVG